MSGAGGPQSWRVDLQLRQFAFVRAHDPVLPGWTRVALPDGWTLHFHPDARIEVLPSPPGAPMIRFGQAFNLDASGEIGAGRFALLKWPDLLPDAGALLSLHYGEKNGRQVVSSSARIAALALEGMSCGPDLGPPLRQRSPINYVPSPGTPFRGVRKLFHDQKIDLPGFRILHRPSQVRRLGGYGAAVDALGEGLCAVAEDLRRRIPGTIYLPLTAGLDSRTLAGALLATGVPFETVTLDYCGKLHSDVLVARAISRKLGLRHHVVKLADRDPASAERFREHTAGSFLGWDHSHVFPGGGYRYLTPGDAMIAGACFEIGRQTAGEACFRGLDFGAATGETVWRRRTETAAPPVFSGFLDDWIAWRRLHPLDMDFAAAFYLDQRIGGWRAALEHGYDLLPGVSICPANDPRIYSALITPDPADQREGRLQRDAIGLLAPELLAFPFNPPTLRHRIRLLRRRVRKDLLPNLARAFLPKAGETLASRP